MTDEIIKLYENAGFIQKRCKDYNCIVCDKNKDCDKYPPLTAEKQLELIKWLAKRQDFGLEYYPYSKVWDAQTQFSWEFYCKTYEHEEFEQALAGLINSLWQDLTEEERKQIKEILSEN